MYCPVQLCLICYRLSLVIQSSRPVTKLSDLKHHSCLWMLFLPLFCIIIRGGRNAPRLFSSIMHPLEKNLGWTNDSLNRTGWITGMDTIQKQSNTFRNTRGYGERPHFFFFLNNFINDCRDASCLALPCRVLCNSSYSLASVTTETALGYTWGFSILPNSHSHSHASTVRSCSLFALPCFLIVRAE